MDDVLSNEETEKVLQFQELTGIEDINVCRDILIRHHWNLEIAYQERERMNEGVPSLFASTLETRAPVVLNDRFFQQIFVSNRNNNNGGAPSGGIFGLFTYVVNSLINWCYTTLSSFVQTLLSVFTERERIVTNPLGDVLKFIEEYNTKYPSHPVFYQGTYAQALNDAKRELKFLLLYLHSESSSPQIQSGQQRITETVNFCRNTLSDRDVIDYINRNMLFWACEVSSPEGYRVSHSINARSYPILVIIALRDNKMTVMGRMEGDCTPEELLGRMRRVVRDNERWLNAARHERLERNLTQTLRAQQDVAYEQSLKADQEKERKRQLEREEQERINREIQAEQEAEERRQELKERLKMELLHRVPLEPPEDESNAISIVFKLPNGMRITRRFLKINSLNDIHNFIFCHPDAPDTFEITQNFPKRILNCGRYHFDQFTGYESVNDIINSSKEQVLTVGDAGLQNREVLFVSDLDA
ncbi:CLUMA_CG006818, isoform A [Clunio marinus]|uniref:CLUMA_CG006818, isoform A n=1 Tax=Clunio marinus TaxID=568069 RepID=A0A1J1HZ92_9DIPT|nr:CLUMA_CG006818, isoform A [Clunio marinus]